MPPKQQASPFLHLDKRDEEVLEEAIAKRKAEVVGSSEAAPEAKAARTDVKEEGPSEKETDDKPDSRPAFTGKIAADLHDATPSVIPVGDGSVLMALSDAGLAHLIAAVRADVGITAGRYFFEARIFELGVSTDPRRTIAGGGPKLQVRVGFSTRSSSLMLGDTEEGVSFDSDGYFCTERKRKPLGSKFARDQVVGVLLNLDDESPNANTISLFKEGERVTEPQPLPAPLKGKTLYPHVAFRGVSLHVHFGPQPMFPLPFKCRMIQAAAKADLEVASAPAKQDQQCNVIFPVALPDEGTFDWLSGYLAQNPQLEELSDRRIVEWGTNSGLPKPKPNQRMSNDKPTPSFGVAALDDMAARKILHAVAPLMERDYVVMEVKGNLIKEERKEWLKRFSSKRFKKIAKVMMGEPPEEYKLKVRQSILKEKQEKLDADFAAKKMERERKKIIEERQRHVLEQRRKVQEEMMRKKEKEVAAAALTAQAKEAKDGGEEQPAGGEQEVKGEEETKEQVKEEGQEPKEEAKEEKQDDEPVKKEEEEEKEPPKAVLTQEEMNIFFKPTGPPDLLPAVLNEAFGKFSVPDQSEGFDEVQFEWQDEATSKAYLRKWVLDKKLVTRIEDIQPSEWFYQKMAEWQKYLQEWQLKQKEFKAGAGAKLKAQKEQERKERLEKAAAEQAMNEEAAKEGADGAEAKATDEKPADLEEALPLDVDAVTDVLDIGDGEPLFASFAFEDWALMSLRFEILLLILAFKKDANDPDRPGMHETHLPFYYQKYYRKQMNTKFYGTATLAELLAMIKDSAGISPEGVIVHNTGGELDELPPLDRFVKLTEVARRERQRRIDAGDETAKIKFSVLIATSTTSPQPAAAPASQQGLLQPRAVSPKGPYQGNWQAAAKATAKVRPGPWNRPSYGQPGNFRPPPASRWPSAYGSKSGWH